MDFLTDNLTTIIIAIIGLAVGASIVLNIRNKSKKRSNDVTQSNNNVEGDMSGGDMNKNIYGDKKE